MNKSKRYRAVPIFAILFLLLTACSSPQENAAHAIEEYISALSSKDSVQLSNLSCNAWQPEALVEMDSLTAVGSRVENLACQQTGEEGTDKYIDCTGFLALDYNGEIQQIDLSSRTYIARQEDGEWRMCGYR